MTTPLSLIVVYATDLDASLRFYRACGITFHEKRDGSGPLHYVASLPTGLVFELYPAGTRPPTRVRLRFTVPDSSPVLQALSAAGSPAASGPCDLDYGRVRVVRDPDGNSVELVEPLS